MKIQNILWFLSISLNAVFSKFFIQISDIHLDLQYTENSADNCILHFTGMPCCRKNQIAKKPFNRVSKWGSYACDTPQLLLNSTFEWIRNNIDDIDFIINTGDNADHHVLFQTFRGNMKAIKSVNAIIKYWFPNIPIYNVLGNHDTYPIDQTLPYYENKVYETIGSYWNHQNVPQSFENGGYYKEELDNLCLLTFNSINFTYFKLSSICK